MPDLATATLSVPRVIGEIPSPPTETEFVKKITIKRRILEGNEMPVFDFLLDLFKVLGCVYLLCLYSMSSLICTLFIHQNQVDYTWFGVPVVTYHQSVSSNFGWVK